MARRKSESTSRGRVHLVMVPGFGGFDALGQLQYYAGVTARVDGWRRAAKGRGHVTLHYFDNFPTAAVATRAERLRAYLAKRVARGEFQPADRVALIGHSTGGLDIRQLLLDLSSSPESPIHVDGGRKTASAVHFGEVLRLVDHVVFLSVPHWGTNIANWVRARPVPRTLTVADLRLAVTASQLPLAALAREGVLRQLASQVDADLLRAIADALTEIDPTEGRPGPSRTASAHEAAAEVALWLDHILWDFRVVDDLAAPGGEPDATGGAPARRADSPSQWTRAAGHPVRYRSYATLARSPFAYSGPAIEEWELLRPETYPGRAASPGTDASYRWCYRACAGGPFSRTVSSDAFRFLDPAHEKAIASWRGSGNLRRWENDGIVNTASMFWQEGDDTVLVAADHMDIVGHFAPEAAFDGGGRELQAYDLLRSASGFGNAQFEAVWTDVLDFCVE